MTTFGAVVGAAIDHAAGEPPVRWHPVARYGSAMQVVERRLYADRRVNGIAHVGAGLAVATTAGWLARRVLGRHAGTAAAVAICAAGRMLDGEAAAMASLLRSGDLPGARARVRSLVGRDAADLDADELARAVVESVAENLVDAVTASIWWGSVAGPIGAFGHRAVNTLDAMVGHRNDRYERFGWAAARLDDALNLIPARLTAVAIALARPDRARTVWRIVQRDAHRHPSPNGGIVEAAFAAALDVTLGGVNRYGDAVEDRGTLGDGPRPTVADIDGAVRLRRRTTAVIAGAAAAIGAAHAAGRRRCRRSSTHR